LGFDNVEKKINNIERKVANNFEKEDNTK